MLIQWTTSHAALRVRVLFHITIFSSMLMKLPKRINWTPLPAGHILCQLCRARVLHCPTCRYYQNQHTITNKTVRKSGCTSKIIERMWTRMPAEAVLHPNVSKSGLTSKSIKSILFQTPAWGQHEQPGSSSDRESEAQMQVLGARMSAQVNWMFLAGILWYEYKVALENLGTRKDANKETKTKVQWYGSFKQVCLASYNKMIPDAELIALWLTWR